MSLASDLKTLEELRLNGSLSEAEFQKAKGRLLNGMSESAAQFTVEDADATWLRKLTLSNTDSKIAGVCGGLGAQGPIPSWVWRVIFVCAVFFGGFGIIVYFVLWALMPRAPASYD